MYVPADWQGPVCGCRFCGNPAPDVTRSLDAANDWRECSLCFIGRVLNETVSPDEARLLRAELAQEIKRPSLPWRSQEVSE